MRIFLLLGGVLAFTYALGCERVDDAADARDARVAVRGGDTETNRDTDAGAPRDASSRDASTDDAPADREDGAAVDASTDTATDAAVCAPPAGVVVPAGGTLSRPAQSVMRITLVYQGAAIGVTAMNGVTMIVPPSSGALSPGVNAGYWFALESATQTLYTRAFADPTIGEGVSDDGGLFAGPVPRCTPKTIHIDVPSDAAATTLVVYGSPYGTDDPAVELGRFSVQ